jgi:hypothetical protein
MFTNSTDKIKLHLVVNNTICNAISTVLFEWENQVFFAVGIILVGLVSLRLCTC